MREENPKPECELDAIYAIKVIFVLVMRRQLLEETVSVVCEKSGI